MCVRGWCQTYFSSIFDLCQLCKSCLHSVCNFVNLHAFMFDQVYQAFWLCYFVTCESSFEDLQLKEKECRIFSFSFGSFSNIPTCTCIGINCLENVVSNFPTVELSNFIWLKKFSFMLATHVGPLQGSTFQEHV